MANENREVDGGNASMKGAVYMWKYTKMVGPSPEIEGLLM